MPFVTQTQINCPVCRQPFSANVQQILDVGEDPAIKDRLLSGQLNLAVCPRCGNGGLISSPLVYHDPAKELLLTYIPAEIQLPQPQREQMIGNMVRTLMEQIPAEARKGYLFNPQAVLTMQGLVDRVLQAEGIPPEVLERQRKQNQLLARLLSASDVEFTSIVEAHDEEIDDQFFQLLALLIGSAQESGQEQDARQVLELRNRLLPLASWSRERGITAQSLDAQQARFELMEAFLSTAEDQWDELIQEHTEELDYYFFQLLTVTAESTQRDVAERLLQLREKLLDKTSMGQEMRAGQDAIDDLRAAADQAGGLTPQLLLDKILAASTPAALEAVASAASPLLDYSFFLLIADRIDEARKPNDQETVTRLEDTRKQLMELTEKWDQARAAGLEQVNKQIDSLLAAQDRPAAVAKALPQIDQFFLGVLADRIQRARQANQGDQAADAEQLMEQILAGIRDSAPPEIQLVNELLEIDEFDQLQKTLDERRQEITPDLVALMKAMREDMAGSNQKELLGRLDRILQAVDRFNQ